MKDIRSAAFSGLFYPDNQQELQHEIKRKLALVRDLPKANDILGAIVPHAGYYYSGLCAAHSYAALAQKNFKTAIIIAPSHKFNHFLFSVGNYQAYRTPLGEMKIDETTAAKFLADANFQFLPQVHAVEHSLEVQIPFLQFIKPEVEIVPILTGKQSLQNSRYLSKQISKIISEQPEDFVVIISSDLSHYHSSKSAFAMDKRLMDFVENLEVERLAKEAELPQLEACGMGGIFSMIYLAQELGYTVKQLKYSHSGQANGDNSQVVGYLASLFYR
jgi:AmmeMemoRadiSam system protein B